MGYRHEICLFLEVTLDLSLNRRHRRRRRRPLAHHSLGMLLCI